MRAVDERRRQLERAPDAHLVRLAHDLGLSEVLRDARRDDILGLVQRRGHRDGAAVAAGVFRRPVAPAEGAVVDRRPGRVAVVEDGGVGEQLERGARLAARLPGVVVLVGEKVAPADPGLDAARRGLHGDQARLELGLDRLERVHERGVLAQLGQDGVVEVGALAAPGRAGGLGVAARAADVLVDDLGVAAPPVAERVRGRAPAAVDDALEAVHLLLDGPVGELLHAAVDGRAQDQAVGVGVVAVLLAPLLEPEAEHLGKVRRHVVLVGVDVEGEADGRRLDVGELAGRQEAFAHHVGEHHVAARLGGLGVLDRVVAVVGRQHADEDGRLGRLELGGGLREVGLAGRLDAVGAVEERDRVEVGRQDLVLGVDALDLDGEQDLADLALDGAVARAVPDALAVEVARELHGDGRGAAQLLALERLRDGADQAP